LLAARTIQLKKLRMARIADRTMVPAWVAGWSIIRGQMDPCPSWMRSGQRDCQVAAIEVVTVAARTMREEG
jgi:hypothetical protein